MENRRGVIVRLSPEMIERIRQYQATIISRERRTCSFTDASREFAQVSVTSNDNLNVAMKKIGKHRLF